VIDMVDRFADDTLIERAPEALSRRTLDGVLVLTPTMSDVLQLSAPGDAIWDLLAEPLTVADLVQALSERFRVPEGAIRSGTRPVLQALFDGGALRVTAASDGHAG
jgi:hypothetical protein